MKTEEKHVTAGELAQKALKDPTKYKAIDIAYAMFDDVEKQLHLSIEKHLDLIDQDEFCVVMVIAKDPLLKTLIRRKYYCWPYLPKPRPNQSVFLYNKKLGRITKRLWVLPCDIIMAELASNGLIVDKAYRTMQAWSIAFFKGTFWEYIRYEHGIDMLSEEEFVRLHREKFIKDGGKPPPPEAPEPFDFSKITINKIADTKDTATNQNVLNSLGKA